MTDDDVIIRGRWSKLDIKKSTEGTIKDNLTLYKQVQEDVDNSNKYAKKYTGDTSTFMGNEDVYYYYGAAANNNVVFANYCWKIVRTTDTGGVKLIYNGVPALDGSCNNIGDDAVLTGEQMNRPKNTVPYNSGLTGLSLADMGYMLNLDSRYTIKRKNFLSQDIISTVIMQASDNYSYYYSDTYRYEDEYILNDPKKYSWSDNFSQLVGKYTCRSTSDTGMCVRLSYVVKTEENRLYYIDLQEGNGINDLGYETTIALGEGIKENVDGTFSIVNPITIDRVDWYTDNAKYRKYYTCGTTETTCGNMKYIRNSSDSAMTYFVVNDYNKYGNSFSYDGKNYTLKDTIDVWDPYDVDTLNNTHYTCFNSSGICENGKIFYIFQISTTFDYFGYIELENGKSVEVALNEMLYDESANRDSSVVKMAIDYWYQNNMTEYTKYLEDTVWCADRSMANKEENGWNPNGGSMLVNLSFGQSKKLDNLSCTNKNDRFTVDRENGNGALIYPVGMITVQEQQLAYNSEFSPRSPLGLVDDKNWYWAITPQDYRDCPRTMRVIANGSIGEMCIGAESYLEWVVGARPTISLKPGILYMSGDGSVRYPYVIDLDTNS